MSNREHTPVLGNTQIYDYFQRVFSTGIEAEMVGERASTQRSTTSKHN